MHCPACGTRMQRRTVIDVDLDQCGACNGFWFDDGEVSHLVPSLAQAGNVPDLNARIIFEPRAAGHVNPQRRCPHCAIVMSNYNYCYDSNILLDRCPECRGIWMDGGELAAVVRYVKGNPRLDRLATAMADRVRSSESRRTADVDFRVELGRTMLTPGAGAVAVLLAAVVDLVRRWERD